MTRITALLDACVIFPYLLSDTLFRAAEKGLYRIYLSERILQEATRNRVARGKMKEENAQRFIEKVIESFPASLCEAPAELEDMMTNDPKDHHVLASAIHVQTIHKVKVNVIVTSNLKDFSVEALEPYGIKAMHPDQFLIELCNEYGEETLYELVVEQATSYKKPPRTYLELITQFEKEQPLFASRLLLYAYHKEISEICSIALKVGRHQNGQLRLNGKNYTILSENQTSIIIERVTSSTVFKIDEDESVIGNLKVKDVLHLKKFSDCDDMRVLASGNVRIRDEVL